MIEVKMPSEIRAYKSKLVFGLSTRQFISLVAAIGVCVPIGAVGRHYMSEGVLFWVIIIVAAPILAFGFFKFKDMNFEDFAKAYISLNFLPQKRVYEDTEENIFCSFSEEILETDIIQQRIDKGEYVLDEEGRE